MAFTYVTLQETYETADDLPARGTVTFTPVDQMVNGITVISGPNTATLDTAGSISIRLAATTDPSTSPVGVTYKVVENIVGQQARTYYVSVPHNAGSTLQLAGLTVIVGSGGAGFALRDAADYDDSVAPTDGQVMTWDGTSSKFHPEAVSAASGVTSVNGASGVVTVTAAGIGAQPVDTDLTALAALTPVDNDLVQRKSGAWTNRTPAQVKTDLALDQVDNTSDAAKPLSSAATTALAGKAATSHTHAASDVVSGTVATARLGSGSANATTFLRGDQTWAATPTSGGDFVAANTQTASYVLAGTDAGKAVEMNSASATTVTVPPNSSVPFPDGTVLEVARIGAGTVTLVAGAGVTLRTPTGTLLLRAQYSTVGLRQRVTNEWLVSGDLA